MSEDKITKTTLENAYFHISNGGYSFEMSKILTEYKNRDGTEKQLYEYTFESSLSSFGTKLKTSFPLGTIDMVDYLIESLTRVKEDMSKINCVSIYNPYWKRRVSIENGQKVNINYNKEDDLDD